MNPYSLNNAQSSPESERIMAISRARAWAQFATDNEFIFSEEDRQIIADRVKTRLAQYKKHISIKGEK